MFFWFFALSGQAADPLSCVNINTAPKEELEKRIATRLDRWFRDGLIEETKKLPPSWNQVKEFGEKLSCCRLISRLEFEKIAQFNIHVLNEK